MSAVDHATAAAEDVSHQDGMVAATSSPTDIDTAIGRSLTSKREEEERDLRTTEEELVEKVIELSQQEQVRTGKQSDVLTAPYSRS